MSAGQQERGEGQARQKQEQHSSGHEIRSRQARRELDRRPTNLVAAQQTGGALEAGEQTLQSQGPLALTLDPHASAVDGRRKIQATPHQTDEGIAVER